jgi:hypothetical protein
VTGYAWISIGIYAAGYQAWLSHSQWYLAGLATGRLLAGRRLGYLVAGTEG